QETPDVLNAIGVDIAAYPFVLIVVNGFMPCVFIGNALVCLPGIGINGFGFWCRLLMDELVKSFSISAGNDLESDLSATLESTDHCRLVSPVAMSDMSFFAAHKRFIHLNSAGEGRRGRFLHRLTDAVTQIPCGLITDVERAFHLVGRNAFLRLRHEVNSQEPFPERQMRIVKNSTRRDAKLIAAPVAVILLTVLHAVDLFRLAAWALYAVRPPESFQV